MLPSGACSEQDPCPLQIADPDIDEAEPACNGDPCAPRSAMFIAPRSLVPLDRRHRAGPRSSVSAPPAHGPLAADINQARRDGADGMSPVQF